MKRFRKPLFLIGFTFVSAAFIASGVFFTQASPGKKDLKNPGKKSSLAAPIMVEDFSYTEGSSLTANGWTAHSGGGTNALTVTSPGLSYSGYAGSDIGNAVSMTTSGEDVNRSFASPVSSGSIYASFLVNVTNSTAAGDYFFHYYVNTSTFWGRVFVRRDAVTDAYSFGISRTANATGDPGPVYTPSIYTNGTTHLLVVKYTFVEGANNDTVSLFVDPTPGVSEPAATLTAVDFGATDAANLPGIGIRQGTASSASTQRVDGIRVAATWEEAVASSGVPGPSSTPQRPNVDMNGDGRTDFVIFRPVESAFFSRSADGERKPSRVRRQRMLDKSQRSTSQQSVGFGPQAEWWAKYNNAPGGFRILWGLTFDDYFISADFDGDGAADVAVWRPDSPGQAAFYSINSTDFTFRYSAFGQTNDDPAVVGDYDGDGLDDPAVFRCPAGLEPDGQCYFFYRGSLNNPSGGITYVPWGFGNFNDWIPYPGDFNGDGKLDFCLQDLRNGPQASFWLQINGTQSHEVISWGLIADLVIPGDFDGDGKSDFTVRRLQDDDRYTFYTLKRAGGVHIVDWGIWPDDPAPGDYDGDGSADIAVYRWNSENPRFWILPSNGDPHWTYGYGIFGDYPLAAWNVQ